ncbi:MAG: hypothetical protein NTV89_00230, partial [Proteobacteria bacterium]|nr:hypothetical protein [Pseudomonadota bacterium]
MPLTVNRSPFILLGSRKSGDTILFLTKENGDGSNKTSLFPPEIKNAAGAAIGRYRLIPGNRDSRQARMNAP